MLYKLGLTFILVGFPCFIAMTPFLQKSGRLQKRDLVAAFSVLLALLGVLLLIVATIVDIWSK
jgi:hypothetical protein